METPRKNHELTVEGVLSIYEIRGEPVVLDQDVARLFGVETRRLNEQVTRNTDKFGDDFAFKLTMEEFATLSRKMRHQVTHGAG